jgi:hypothetical protein
MSLSSLERRRPLARARGLLLGGALGAVFLFGCGQPPDAPEPGAASAAPSSEESAAFAARVRATGAEARQRAARAASAPPVVLPSPQPTPGGGSHVDMRGRPDHVHRLEKQPDGTWRQICRSTARPLASGSGQ